MNGTIKSWIYGSVNNVLLHLPYTGIAAQMWKALDKKFLGSSQAQIMDLRLPLQTTQKGNASMDDYLVHVKKVSDHLAALDDLHSLF